MSMNLSKMFFAYLLFTAISGHSMYAGKVHDAQKAANPQQTQLMRMPFLICQDQKVVTQLMRAPYFWKKEQVKNGASLIKAFKKKRRATQYIDGVPVKQAMRGLIILCAKEKGKQAPTLTEVSPADAVPVTQAMRASWWNKDACAKEQGRQAMRASVV